MMVDADMHYMLYSNLKVIFKKAFSHTYIQIQIWMAFHPTANLDCLNLDGVTIHPKAKQNQNGFYFENRWFVIF